MATNESSLVLGVPRETFPGEQRVALVPSVIAPLLKKGCSVWVEAGAGEAAGFPDSEYQAAQAQIAGSRDEIFEKASVILQVRAFGANPEAGQADLARLRNGQIVVSFLDPLADPSACVEPAKRGVTSFAMELIPRISRAQVMDALSSQANLSGYKSVLLAAGMLPKIFPMMMTAAGTISPAHVFIIGAGVAGLQAIATARRLGAVVQAYDVRPAVKDQVQSLGARFVELSIESRDSEDSGGYAKAQDETFYQKQRELMTQVVAHSDVVITTAAVLGKKAPILLTRDMVEHMKPGSIVVDLASERGGNCECTSPGETVQVNGVTILGPLNLPSSMPYHASQMYAKNIATFALELIKQGGLQFNLKDEVLSESLVTHHGEVVHPRVRESLGLAPSHPEGSQN